MAKLDPPLKRYLLGAYPSHSSTKGLYRHFEEMSTELFYVLLKAGEYLDKEGKITLKAVDEELVDSCDRKLLWNLKRVEEVLTEVGVILKRKPVNQEVELPENGEPVWVNLGTLSTYFSVTANQVGKWLDELGLREDNEPTKEALDRGLATFLEMHIEGTKTRRITHWNLHPLKILLIEAGHELDFNYEESLKGKGKNSDVIVSSIDEKAKSFTREFVSLYNNASTRSKTKLLVQSTPTGVLKKSEELLKKPGFLTSGEYLKNF